MMGDAKHDLDKSSSSRTGATRGLEEVVSNHLFKTRTAVRRLKLGHIETCFSRVEGEKSYFNSNFYLFLTLSCPLARSALNPPDRPHCEQSSVPHAWLPNPGLDKVVLHSRNQHSLPLNCSPGPFPPKSHASPVKPQLHRQAQRRTETIATLSRRDRNNPKALHHHTADRARPGMALIPASCAVVFILPTNRIG
jgi:hypothetical protein